MRNVKLTGREASVVRAIGFAEGLIGSEIGDQTRMEIEDVTDTINSLVSAGYIETTPFTEEVHAAELAGMMFEVNPAYVHQLKQALQRR